MSDKTLILYTGGTIGMQHSETGYRVVDNFEQLLAQKLSSSSYHYDVLALQNPIDSSNVTPLDWRQIALTLQQSWDDYSGFVVLHGTDTMAFSASAVSFMLASCDKAVIFTGSQIPLAVERNDAYNNLLSALELANHPQINEVCLLFAHQLLRANRARKMSSTKLAAFSSPNCPALATLDIQTHINTSMLRKAQTVHFIIPKFRESAVAVLTLYPGFSAQILEAVLQDPRVQGIVLQTYGAGNPPDANRALIDTLEKAINRGVVVVNISQCPHGKVQQGNYAVSSIFNQIGVTPGGDLTLEAAFTKLHFLIAQALDSAKIRQLMQRELCAELSTD